MKNIVTASLQLSVKQAAQNFLSLLTEEQKELLTDWAKNNSFNDFNCAVNSGEIGRKINLAASHGVAKMGQFINHGLVLS